MNHDKSHTDETVRGLSWNSLRVLFQTFSSIFVIALLARFLPPADFGLMALAVFVIGFGDLLGTLGMGPAIVQRKELSNQDVSVAQTLSVLIGSIVTVCVCISAHFVALYFEQPMLENMIYILATTLWLSAFGAVYRGLLIRRLNFKSIFLVDFSGYVFGYVLVTITCIFYELGVMSLVYGALAQSILMTCLLIIANRQLLGFSFDVGIAKKLMYFGTGQSLNGAVNYLAANIDTLFIGKFLGPTSLGLYSRASQLMTLPITKLATSISSVMFSSYAQIQTNKPLLKRNYLAVVELTALVIFPILAGFFIGAHWLIVGLFGDNWQDIVVTFQILCIAGLFKTVFNLAGSIIQALGLVYNELLRQCIYLVVLLFGCLSVVSFGVEAVAWVVVLASFYLYVSLNQLVLKLIECDWRLFFQAQKPGFILGLIIIAFGVIFNVLIESFFSAPAELLLTLFIIQCAIVYVGAILWLPSSLIGSMPSQVLQRFSDRLPLSMFNFIAKYSIHSLLRDKV